MEKSCLGSGDLYFVSKVALGHGVFKKPCRDHISWLNGFIKKKTCKNESHGDGKNWSDVEDLDLIVNVTEGQRTVENGLSAPYLLHLLLSLVIDFDQKCTGNRTETIN